MYYLKILIFITCSHIIFSFLNNAHVLVLCKKFDRIKSIKCEENKLFED